MYRDDEEKRDAEEAEEPRKTRITGRGLLTVAICGALLALGTGWLRGLFEQTDAKGIFFVLSDSFLVPGAVFMGIGGLSWVSTQGMFDIMGYGCSSFFGRFIPFDSVYRRRESYYDYKVKRDERGRTWKVDMLIAGGGFFLLSVVMFLLYSAV